MRCLNNTVRQTFSDHAFSVGNYYFERGRSDASGPEKIMIVIIQLNPIFAFGCSPAPHSAKTLEIVDNLPYLGHFHTFAPTPNDLLEQSSSLSIANLSVFVNVFRKNEDLDAKNLQFCRYKPIFYTNLQKGKARNF